MKQHHGMRPQDIVILLKIISLKEAHWQLRDLAFELSISVSEVSASLHRSHIAGLLDVTRRKIHRQSLMEFIQYGLRYVFPQVPGSLVTGIPTAHSYQFFKERFPGETEYVWPAEDGTLRGQAIQPLHAGVPKAVNRDETLHKLLAGVDILRVGRKREINVALKELKKHISPDYNPHNDLA